jgi:hypothetical protein
MTGRLWWLRFGLVCVLVLAMPHAAMRVRAGGMDCGQYITGGVGPNCNTDFLSQSPATNCFDFCSDFYFAALVTCTSYSGIHCDPNAGGGGGGGGGGCSNTVCEFDDDCCDYPYVSCVYGGCEGPF